MLNLPDSRRSALSTLTLCGVFMLHGCSDSSSDTMDPEAIEMPQATLDWQSCGVDRAASLECSTLEVPLVHDDTSDERTLTIDLARLPASGDGPARSLLMNPGGPGGRGTDLVDALARAGTVPVSIRQTHDLVGFDPRGTGASARIDCDDLGYADLDDYLEDRGDLEAFEAMTRSAADLCIQRHGDTLTHLGSMAVVRDMELIRAALGQARLDFLGYSYGSRLGALYLQNFPDQAGRFVLDGSTPPNGSTRELVIDQALGAQRNLQRLFGDCGERVAGCEYAAFAEKLQQRVDQLVDEEADEETVALFGVLLITAVQEPDFGDLAVVPLINFVETGDVGVLTEFVQLLDTLDIDVVDSADDEDSSHSVQLAVLCADDASRPGIDAMVEYLGRLNQASDLFAEAFVSIGLGCSGLPDAVEPVGQIFTRAAPVSIVIGGPTDALTLIERSNEMADAIGGVFVASDHDGHTVVFQDKSRCVDQLVVDFLLDGALPVETDCHTRNTAGVLP